MATGGATEGSVSAAQDSVARAHEILLRHRDLQFEFASFTPPQPPPWLKTLARLLEAIAPYVGYVFWGGREGYETLLNTDVKFEQENIARLMRMAVDYGRSIGFTGDFYIEPKPKEPSIKFSA